MSRLSDYCREDDDLRLGPVEPSARTATTLRERLLAGGIPRHARERSFATFPYRERNPQPGLRTLKVFIAGTIQPACVLCGPAGVRTTGLRISAGLAATRAAPD